MRAAAGPPVKKQQSDGMSHKGVIPDSDPFGSRGHGDSSIEHRAFLLMPTRGSNPRPPIQASCPLTAEPFLPSIPLSPTRPPPSPSHPDPFTHPPSHHSPHVFAEIVSGLGQSGVGPPPPAPAPHCASPDGEEGGRRIVTESYPPPPPPPPSPPCLCRRIPCALRVLVCALRMPATRATRGEARVLHSALRRAEGAWHAAQGRGPVQGAGVSEQHGGTVCVALQQRQETYTVPPMGSPVASALVACAPFSGV